MDDEKIVRLDRSAVVDTSAMKAIMFTVSTTEARGLGAVPEEMAAVIGRLVLGQAVPLADLERWKVAAMRIYSMDELAAEGPPTGITNVGPAIPLDEEVAKGRVQPADRKPNLRIVANQSD